MSASIEVCDIPTLWSVLHHTALQHLSVFPILHPKSGALLLAWPLHGLCVCVCGKESQWRMGRDGNGGDQPLQCTKTLVHNSTLKPCSHG